MLEDHADLVAHLMQVLFIGWNIMPVAFHVPQGQVINKDVTGIKLCKGHQHAQDRRLAGAAEPDDCGFLACAYFKVKIVEHRQIAEGLGDSFKCQPHD
jgi:hypothetical protein